VTLNADKERVDPSDGIHSLKKVNLQLILLTLKTCFLWALMPRAKQLQSNDGVERRAASSEAACNFPGRTRFSGAFSLEHVSDTLRFLVLAICRDKKPMGAIQGPVLLFGM
jgi:hypothetical protein